MRNKLIWLIVTAILGLTAYVIAQTCQPVPGVSIMISPQSVTLSSGQVEQFTATVTGASDTSVAWTLSPSNAGVITTSGVYTAPTVVINTTVLVTSTSKADASKFAQATVVLTPPNGAIQASPTAFFGVHVHGGAANFSGTINLQAYRSKSSGIDWDQIETCDGKQDPTNACFTWTAFDAYVAAAKTLSLTITYDVYHTPSWAAATNNLPPTDVAADGSGTDQHFIDFVTAVMTHAKTGTIKYWQVWNAANITSEYNGTIPQLVRMEQDLATTVHFFDVSAQVISAPVNGTTAFSNYLPKYFAAGGGRYADIIGINAYTDQAASGLVCPDSCPSPDDVWAQISLTKTAMAQNNLSKPIVITEGSWGASSNMTDWDLRTAYMARWLLLGWEGGVQQAYWFGEDFAMDSTTNAITGLPNGGTGELWAPAGNPDSCSSVDANGGKVCPTGLAWNQVYAWVSAATPGNCTQTASVWECKLTKTGTYQALAVWDSSQSCSGGTCTTSDYEPDPLYTQYKDLAGATTTITTPTVSIGLKPLLFEHP